MRYSSSALLPPRSEGRPRRPHRALCGSGARVIGILGLALCIPATARSLTWTRVEELPASDIETLQLFGTTLYATGSDSVFQGATLGTTWTASNPVGAGGAPLFTVIPAGGSLWAGSFGHGVFQSPNDGQSWNALSSGLSGLGADHINEFSVRDDTLFAATDGAGVYALDLATHTVWSDFNNGLPVFTSGTVPSIVLHGTTLVAQAGPNGLMYRYLQGAATWEEIPLRPPFLSGFLATDLYSDGTNLLVTNGSSVYRSTDDAQSWTLAGDGLSRGSATFLAGDGSTLYAVVDFLNNTHQLFLSRNGGDSWQLIEDVADTFVYEIEVAGDRLFAARTDGLWWTPLAMVPVRPASWGQMKTRFRQ
jgi:hypothetical protein